MQFLVRAHFYVWGTQDFLVKAKDGLSALEAVEKYAASADNLYRPLDSTGIPYPVLDAVITTVIAEDSAIIPISSNPY